MIQPLVNPPQKPFSKFKWRWASFTPSESLNAPPVFLGVLRVFTKYENFAPSAPEVMNALSVVQMETTSSVDLVRTQDRNLIRNSGQYWKALGLLEEASGKIKVSPFGKLLADGRITDVEFATTVVKTLELPNRRIEEPASIAAWDGKQLKIKPLELILDVLGNISSRFGQKNGYITPGELQKIIIPLSGDKAKPALISDAIMQSRQGLIDISHWPDCAPSSNDRRMVREFLLFLSNYGFCHVEKVGRGNADEKYFLSSISREEIIALHALKTPERNLEVIARIVRESHIPAHVERKRILREILERPYQSAFRKNVLAAFEGKCLVTGVTMENVLEASHIVDVKYNGSDKIANGLCLRSDIHQLFDSKHLNILPNGKLVLSEQAMAKQNYAGLPKEVELPDFVSRGYLDWRVKYT